MVKSIIGFLRKFFFLINFIVAIYSLLVFQLSLSADMKHWIVGFLMMTVPLCFALNLIFLFFYLLSKSPKFLLSLGILIIGYPLIERSVNYKLEHELGSGSFSVMSYNLMYADYLNGEANSSFTTFVDSLSSDILCFQEFYSSSKSDKLNLYERLHERYPHSVYLNQATETKRRDGALGLVTFSKYPVLSVKELTWKVNNNGVLLTNLLVDEDTLTVVNLQFRSMGIRVQKVLNANEEQRASETKNILSQLKEGFEARAGQTTELESLLSTIKNPCILVGDFNELPFGYSYGRVSRRFKNSFEAAGKGFGFTYRKILDFIRIDNQFFDRELIKIGTFETWDHISISDHYPLWATYEVL